MTVTRCDICKKKIDRDEPCYLFTIKNTHNFFELDNHVEICKRCHADFYDWIQERKEALYG